MTNPDRDELVKLETERAELIAKNEAATSWGAAVGARSERIKGLDGRIAALRTAPGATTKSDGGVEGHAIPRTTSATTTRYPETEGEENMVATARRTEGQPSTKTGQAGVEPGPSGTRPADVTVDELTAALDRLVNAKALKGVRSLVAGWNGEDRDEPYKERHPSRLGATLPKTNCGAVYELDEAMQSARALLDTYKIGVK